MNQPSQANANCWESLTWADVIYIYIYVYYVYYIVTIYHSYICHICNVSIYIYILYSQIVKNLAKSLTNTAHTETHWSLWWPPAKIITGILTVHSLNDVKHIISRNDMGKPWKTWDYPNYMGNHGNICGPFNNYPSHIYGFSTRMHQVYAGIVGSAMP